MKDKDPIKVFIIDDNDDIIDELENILEASDSCVCVGKFRTCENALLNFNALKPNIILMDIDLPGMSGIEGIKEFKKRFDYVNIIMLTVHDDAEMVFKALRAGALGYLDKGATDKNIIASIMEVFNGGSPMSANIARLVVSSFKRGDSVQEELTNREQEVLDLLCKGSSYKEIASALGVSIVTIQFHIKNVYQKLQVNSKTEAVSKVLGNRIQK